MATHQTMHPLPRPAFATTLTATTNDMQPSTSYLVYKTTNPATVARHSMIVQPALHNASKPAGRFAKRPVHSLVQLLLDHVQCCTYTLRHTLTLDGEPAMRSGLGTLVCETKKIKRDRKSTRLNSSPRRNLVCRLLLEKKNKLTYTDY